MRRHRGWTTAAACVVGLVLVVGRPVGATEPPAERPAEPPKIATFTGVIQLLDTKQRTLEVTAVVITKTFAAAPDCEVVTEEQPKASLDDLRVGDAVNVTYQEQAEMLVAHRIEQKNLGPVEKQIPNQPQPPAFPETEAEGRGPVHF